MRHHVASRAAGGGGWSLRRLTVLGAALGVLLLAGGTATQAQAGNTMYCDQQVLSADYCWGSAQYLTGNEAFNYFSNSYPVCAGAYLLGSFTCGSLGYAKHCYAGTTNTAPGIYNNYSLTQHMYGWSYWGSDSCPT